LLVAFVPALLMLVTFGMARLEARLANDTVTAKDVAEFLEQAEADDVSTLARAGMPEALHHMHRRQSERLADTPVAAVSRNKHHADPFYRAAFAVPEEPGLPTRRHRHSRANPQFRPTRHANPV
jgi:Na+-transporting methylmalonyl-CoA/oxaloacetate decarboxylase gamma subunit